MEGSYSWDEELASNLDRGATCAEAGEARAKVPGGSLLCRTLPGFFARATLCFAAETAYQRGRVFPWLNGRVKVRDAAGGEFVACSQCSGRVTTRGYKTERQKNYMSCK